MDPLWSSWVVSAKENTRMSLSYRETLEGNANSLATGHPDSPRLCDWQERLRDRFRWADSSAVHLCCVSAMRGPEETEGKLGPYPPDPYIQGGSWIEPLVRIYPHAPHPSARGRLRHPLVLAATILLLALLPPTPLLVLTCSHAHPTPTEFQTPGPCPWPWPCPGKYFSSFNADLNHLGIWFSTVAHPWWGDVSKRQTWLIHRILGRKQGRLQPSPEDVGTRPKGNPEAKAGSKESGLKGVFSSEARKGASAPQYWARSYLQKQSQWQAKHHNRVSPSQDKSEQAPILFWPSVSSSG